MRPSLEAFSLWRHSLRVRLLAGAYLPAPASGSCSGHRSASPFPHNNQGEASTSSTAALASLQQAPPSLRPTAAGPSAAPAPPSAPPLHRTPSSQRKGHRQQLRSQPQLSPATLNAPHQPQDRHSVSSDVRHGNGGGALLSQAGDTDYGSLGQVVGSLLGWGGPRRYSVDSSLRPHKHDHYARRRAAGLISLEGFANAHELDVEQHSRGEAALLPLDRPLAEPGKQQQQQQQQQHGEGGPGGDSLPLQPDSWAEAQPALQPAGDFAPPRRSSVPGSVPGTWQPGAPPGAAAPAARSNIGALVASGPGGLQQAGGRPRGGPSSAAAAVGRTSDTGTVVEDDVPIRRNDTQDLSMSGMVVMPVVDQPRAVTRMGLESRLGQPHSPQTAQEGVPAAAAGGADLQRQDRVQSPNSAAAGRPTTFTFDGVMDRPRISPMLMSTAEELGYRLPLPREQQQRLASSSAAASAAHAGPAHGRSAPGGPVGVRMAQRSALYEAPRSSAPTSGAGAAEAPHAAAGGGGLRRQRSISDDSGLQHAAGRLHPHASQSSGFTSGEETADDELPPPTAFDIIAAALGWRGPGSGASDDEREQRLMQRTADMVAPIPEGHESALDTAPSQAISGPSGLFSDSEREGSSSGRPRTQDDVDEEEALAAEEDDVVSVGPDGLALQPSMTSSERELFRLVSAADIGRMIARTWRTSDDFARNARRASPQVRARLGRRCTAVRKGDGKDPSQHDAFSIGRCTRRWQLLARRRTTKAAIPERQATTRAARARRPTATPRLPPTSHTRPPSRPWTPRCSRRATRA